MNCPQSAIRRSARLRSSQLSQRNVSDRRIVPLSPSDKGRELQNAPQSQWPGAENPRESKQENISCRPGLADAERELLLRSIEDSIWKDGDAAIAGVDEAGRGSLAGPVVAAACIIPKHVVIEGINDSKRLTPRCRELAYERLTRHREVYCAISMKSAAEIDSLNILQATLKAMEEAVRKLPVLPDHVLIDGNQRPKGIAESKSTLVIKGDSRCYSIAAASIIAKVSRDRLMTAYDKQFPGYGFAKHKGYGTAMHFASLNLLGTCPIHRMSYAPVAAVTDHLAAKTG